LTEDIFEKVKINLTPEIGFDLVGIDYFADSENQLYLVEHFEIKRGRTQMNILFCIKGQEENFAVDKSEK